MGAHAGTPLLAQGEKANSTQKDPFAYTEE